MKMCDNCLELKWIIKDLKSEIKELEKQVLELDDKVFFYESRNYVKQCGYCPRDYVGHYEDCERSDKVGTCPNMGLLTQISPWDAAGVLKKE